MKKIIFFVIIILSQTYQFYVVLNAFYSQNGDAHFLVFKEFIRSPSKCGRINNSCTIRDNHPRFRLIGQRGQLLTGNFYRVITMNIRSLDRALFFLHNVTKFSFSIFR